MVRLFSTGDADVASWYGIWQAVQAVFAICTRARMRGTFTGIGVFPPQFSPAVGLPYVSLFATRGDGTEG